MYYVVLRTAYSTTISYKAISQFSTAASVSISKLLSRQIHGGCLFLVDTWQGPRHLSSDKSTGLET